MQRPRPIVTKASARAAPAASGCLALDVVLPQICNGGRAELESGYVFRPGPAGEGLAFTE